MIDKVDPIWHGQLLVWLIVLKTAQASPADDLGEVMQGIEFKYRIEYAGPFLGPKRPIAHYVSWYVERDGQEYGVAYRIAAEDFSDAKLEETAQQAFAGAYTALARLKTQTTT
jgi:hypothetical protein